MASAEAMKSGLVTTRHGGRKPWLVTAMDTAEEAEFVVEEIKLLQRQGRSWNEIAIVARSWRHLREIVELLDDNDIPTIGHRHELTKAERRNVATLLSLVRLALNPQDVESLRLALRLPKGVGPKTLAPVIDAVAESNDVRKAALGHLKGKILRSFLARKQHPAGRGGA